jgi:O-antigen/teichoic acid export membrane protein
MQSDRLVLSHVSDAANLAVYNLGSQMFLPVWQVVTAAGAALWPIFARARARGDERNHSPFPIAGGFAAAAAGACLVIALCSPWLARLASGGEIEIPVSMLVAFSVFMVCQAIQYPLGQFLTDAAGLRVTAFFVVLMVPVNLGLSIVLAERYGAVGPVIGSAVAALIFQVGGNSAYARYRLRNARS